MKRKLAFALLFTTTLGGAWSCLTWGQDPFGPARVGRPLVTTTRNLTTVGDGGETVTIAGIESPVAGWTIADGRYSFEENVSKLVKELKSTEGANKESVLTKLKSAVGEQFDNRQEGKAKELKALEEQLAKLKEIHAKRTQQREQIVATVSNSYFVRSKAWAGERILTMQRSFASPQRDYYQCSIARTESKML